MKFLYKIISVLILSSSYLSADATGSASIFSFFNGIALENNEVLVDGKYKHYTDEDGCVEIILKVGKHRVEIFAKDEDGNNLGYSKSIIEIIEYKDTQLIATFNDNSSVPYVEIDTPRPQSDNKIISSKFKGILNGEVLTSDKNLPIANARVFVKGTSIDAKTDKNGKFSVEIPADVNVSISVVHSEYSAQTIANIRVTHKKIIEKQIKLTPASMELEEFIVLAPKVEGSISSLVQEVKNSNSISSVIGSEQMSKQGDSNAASALKRVAGVTIIGGKYIYVRGLGDRYSATELNGMSLPSPNPIKRTVPLDMFPSGVIGSLQIQKTASADVTSAFGGGYVNVRTKNKFNEEYVKLKLGVSAHSSQGKDAITSQGSGKDWTGYDDGYRTISENFIDSLRPKVGEVEPTMDQSRTEMQNILSSRSYNHKNIKVPYGKSIGMEFTKEIELNDEHKIYILGGYGYKNSYKNIEYTDYDYILSSNGKQSENPDNTAITQRYVNDLQHGGMLNLGYQYKSLDLKLLKLYVLNTLDQTRFVEGTFGENNSDQQQTYYEWQERTLDVTQLSGGFDYKIITPNRFDFGIEFATANEFVPNDIEYQYLKTSIPGSEYQFLRNQSKFVLSSRTTDDEVDNFYLKNKTNIPLLSDADYIEYGISKEAKNRKSRVTSIEMKSRIRDTDITTQSIDEIVNYENPESSLRYSLLSLPKESFDANLNKDTFFVKSLIKPTNDTDITFGLRFIDLKQTISQFDEEDGIILSSDNTLAFKKKLPSIALKHAFNKSNQIKMGYSETFVYPDFREFANTEFIHPVFLAKIAGNPELVEADIKSYDLQYGYYFNETDNITASLFYKQIKNPIEDVRTFTSSTLDRFSFENSSAAELSGVELSWYKNLDFIHSSLNNLTFFGNYTYIKSEVALTEEQKEKFVTTHRGLQGLSPRIINLALTYQEKERTLNLSYNKMSRRLMRVALKNGNVILGLDDYEEPPHLLDFTWIEKLKIPQLNNSLDITFKIKNILNSETVWSQENKTTLKYNTGSSFSFSIGAKI